MIATPGEAWPTVDWNQDILLMEDIHFNIAQYLDEEGINLTEE